MALNQLANSIQKFVVFYIAIVSFNNIEEDTIKQFWCFDIDLMTLNVHVLDDDLSNDLERSEEGQVRCSDSPTQYARH